MIIQAYFRNLGIAVSWIERLAIFAFLIWGLNKAGAIYSQVGLQKSLIVFVAVAYIAGKMLFQYWAKPLLWKKKNPEKRILTLFWDYDRLDNSAMNYSIEKRMILFGVSGFFATTSGMLFFLFLFTGKYEVTYFFLSAVVFVVSFRYFSHVLKSLG